MLLIAQRVFGAEQGVNVSAYVHPPTAAPLLGRDPTLAFDHSTMSSLGLAPSLALTVHAVREPNAKVMSFLDVAFPEAMPAATVAGLIEQGILRHPPGTHDATWASNGVGLRFHAEASFDVAKELKYLKSAMLPVLGRLVTGLLKQPPIAVRPPHPVRIYQDRAAHGVRYELDPMDRQTLMTLVGALPASLSVADEKRDEFQYFALVPLEHVVVETLTNASMSQIIAYGGAVIIDRTTGSVIWEAS